jgi:hypothetical protein
MMGVVAQSMPIRIVSVNMRVVGLTVTMAIPVSPSFQDFLYMIRQFFFSNNFLVNCTMTKPVLNKLRISFGMSTFRCLIKCLSEEKRGTQRISGSPFPPSPQLRQQNPLSLRHFTKCNGKKRNVGLRQSILTGYRRHHLDAMEATADAWTLWGRARRRRSSRFSPPPPHPNIRRTTSRFCISESIFPRGTTVGIRVSGPNV